LKEFGRAERPVRLADQLSKMNILHLTERFRDGAVGGAQVSVDLLATTQAESGHKVTVVSMSDSPLDQKVEGGLRSIKLPLRRAYQSLRHEHPPLWQSVAAHLCDGYLYSSPSGFSEILDEIKPDVVHSHIISGFSSAVWKSAREKRSTVVHTIRDYYILCARSTCYKHGAQCETICGECKLLRLRAGFHTVSVHAVVGISEYILNAHLEHNLFHDTPIRKVIPNSVNLHRHARESNGSRESGVRFGFLGRIVELKGIWELIRAFQERAAESDRLFVAGEGSSRTMERLSNIRDSRIQFVGYRDPASFFEDIDILVVPSLWEEPFGRTVAESLRSGVPVLASKRGGVPEIISKEDLGMLFDPDETGSLGNAISSIRHSFLSGRYNSKTIAKHAEMYAPERVCQSYEEVYNSAIEFAVK
jgi:glycosyltransferase involved in cell wall biosynthesis